MLSENKLRKYLIYAVGEIILVVIGILIALQINNWNESRKSQKQEGLLVDQMITDAQADSLFYESRMRVLLRHDSIVDYVLFINEFPTADTSTSILANREILPYAGFILLSEVLDNYEYAKENIRSWEIKQRLQELKKNYQYLETNITLYNEELQRDILPFDKRYYRTFKKSSMNATLDDLREIFINEELEIMFSSLRDRSNNSMLDLEDIATINNNLLEELRDYRLTFPD